MLRALLKVFNIAVVLSLLGSSSGRAPLSKALMPAASQPPVGTGSSQTSKAAPSSPAASIEATAQRVTSSDLARIAAGLPSDPAEAALRLAGLIYQADSVTAQAAAGELLRRAGLPLVSTSGPVIGWPDDLFYAGSEIYVDFLPQMVDSVRSGDFYTPTQVTGLLTAIYTTTTALPPEALVAFLAGWGKDPDAPAELAWAGTAARALSAQRGQVFYPQADMLRVHIDLLQTTLLLGQLTGIERRRSQGTLPGRSSLASFKTLPLQAGDCSASLEVLENDDKVYQATLGISQKIIKKEFIKALGSYGKIASYGIDAYNIIPKVLSWYLLVTGARLTLTADRKEVHFHHPGGGHDQSHVNLKATATFASTATESDIQCYALAGITIPPGGAMGAGFLIRWNVDQENVSFISTYTGRGEGKYVTVTKGDWNKIYGCGACGDRTDQDGVSTLSLYTRTEPEPGGVGEEQDAYVKVIAKLDKEDFPFKMADFIMLSEADAMKFGVKKNLDLFLSILKRIELPAQELPIKVTYHAPSIYVAKGQQEIYSGLGYNMLFTVDMYSCDGIAGPWHEEGGFQLKKWAFTETWERAVSKVFGANIHAAGTEVMEQQTFKIDPAQTNWVPLNTGMQMFGKMRLHGYYQAYYKKYGKSPPHEPVDLMTTQIAGEVEVFLGGLSFANFEEVSSQGPFLLYIEEAGSDPRCPAGDPTFGEE